MFDVRSLMAALLLAVLPAAAAPSSAPSVDEILASSDRIRNPSEPFTTRIDITEYRNKRRTQEGSISAYAKMNPRRGQYDSLVRIHAPARDRGKMMLKNGNEIWFFDPSTKSGMRISPQQRLLGQAANGDVVTVNLARDYRGAVQGVESVADGDRVPRDCYRLKLTAASSSVTYHAIEYWVERGSFRPVKAKFYSDSGRLMKSAYYRRYEQQLGQVRPTETVIIDGVDTQLVTVLRYSQYQARDIPDSWLTRDGLQYVRD